MRLDKIWIMAKKDLAEFRTNKYVMYSIILMPLLLSIVLPVVYLAPITFTASTNEPLDVGNGPILVEMVDQTLSNGTYENTSFLRCDLSNVVVSNCRIEGSNLTASLVHDSFVGNSTLNSSALFHSNYIGLTTINSITSSSVDIGGITEDQKFLIQYLNFMLIFFIMIPVILPTVMASYSFVGEKLNKSLEPLLATPTTDAELLLGKALSIFLPCMLATWLAFVPFVILANYMTAPVLGYSVLPDAVWFIGVFLLAPLFCIMSIALNVVVSSRVNDVRASQQVGSLIVLPIVLFFIIALAGLFSLGPEVMLALSGVVVAVDVGIVYLSLKTFRREQILIRWK